MEQSHGTRLELYQNVIASLDEGIVVLDRDLTVVTFNQAAQQISGILKDRAAGKAFAQLFHRNGDVVALATRALNLGKTFAELETNLIDGEGKLHPVSATASPILDSKGEVLGVAVLLRDLSLIRVMEEDLKNRERLAQVGTLAAGVAHELRNPLGGIKALLGILQRGLEGQTDLEECARRISREVDRINIILEELLDLGRPGTLRLSRISLNKLLAEVVGAGGPLAEEKGAELVTDLDVSLPPVLGEEPRLFQLFFNLLKNGLEAVGRKGTVKVSSRMVTDYRFVKDRLSQGKMTRVDFTDNGVGISPEELDKIFTPFYTTKPGGTGLGLAICARIVDEHKGSIQVTSSLGRGTTVNVLLPVALGEIPE